MPVLSISGMETESVGERSGRGRDLRDDKRKG
jgi:hypothetical protein